MTGTRGRPRKFDEQAALQAALDVFWTKGLSATSLDDLGLAMEMNRPSIYRAFGDKETIYRSAIAQFSSGMEEAFEQTMEAEDDIKVALSKFYLSALGIYTAGEAPRGCMVMSTAVTAATLHPEIQTDLLGLIHHLDKKIAQRFAVAQSKGQLDSEINVQDLASFAQGLLHSLSLRARAGDSIKKLRRMVKSGVTLLIDPN